MDIRSLNWKYYHKDVNHKKHGRKTSLIRGRYISLNVVAVNIYINNSYNLSEKNEFCLGAVHLLRLVSEIHAVSPSGPEPTIFGPVAFVAMISS
jgi:hypothetical protein